MIDEEVLAHIIDKLGEAENLPLNPSMITTPVAWNGATVIGVGLGIPGVSRGFEGLVRVFTPEHATLFCVNGCPCGCQLVGEWNGTFWSITHAENGISAN